MPKADKPVKGRRILVALGAYGAMAGLAVLWAVLAGRPNLLAHPGPWLTLPFPAATAVSLGVGLVLAASVVAMTRVLVRHARWAQELHVELRELLGPLSASEITVFALSSGISEELFFRGAMQPSLGLLLTSVIFGAVHIGPGKRFLPWMLWAAVMGLAFGALYEATGDLTGPIAAHIVINRENMIFIADHDPRPPPPGRGPRLASRVERQ